jgi:hypothetical protein
VRADQGRRRRPRGAHLIEAYLRALQPALGNWAASTDRCARSLKPVAAEISADNDAARGLIVSALHSQFEALKSERLIFIDPTTGLNAGAAVVRPALPLE